MVPCYLIIVEAIVVFAALGMCGLQCMHVLVHSQINYLWAQ